MRTPWKLVVAIAVAGVLLATGGTWLYINVIRDDAPDRLTLDGGSSGSGSAETSSPTTTGATAGQAAAGEGVDGTWKVAAGSQAGYRVDEILFGQAATAVGRTEEVSGQVEIVGTRVVRGSFTVDMASVQSDSDRRDNQFRGRIMDVASHPTSTFTLTSPIEVGGLPGEGREVKVKATGDLTLRGTTRSVTFDLAAQRAASSIRVAGSIPIVFEEWGIPNPSFGPAETEDHGELEFLLVLSR